jgi:hypothetical protein
MRGIKIINQLQYELEVKLESFAQGDTIAANIMVKKNGVNPIGKFSVSLALGSLKKVREDETAAFEIIETKNFEQTDKAEIVHDFEFNLKENCPITDNQHSLYIIYGESDGEKLTMNAGSFGHLQLSVHPHQLHKEILTVWELFFRFKMKSQKAKKKAVEYKLIPPPGKTYPGLEGVTLFLEKVGDKIVQKVGCQIKKIDYSGVSAEDKLKMKKEEKSFTQEFSPSEYLIYGKAFNQEKIKGLIEAALKEHTA